MNNNLTEKSIDKFTGKKWNEISETEQKMLLDIAGVPMDYVRDDNSCIIEFTGTPLFISGYSNGLDKNPTPNDDAIIVNIKYVNTEELQKIQTKIDDCIALMDEAVDFGTCTPEEYDSIVEDYNKLIAERDVLLSQTSAVSAKNIVPLAETKSKTTPAQVTKRIEQLKNFNQNSNQLNASLGNNINNTASEGNKNIQTTEAQNQSQPASASQQLILPCQLPDMGMGGMNFGM